MDFSNIPMAQLSGTVMGLLEVMAYLFIFIVGTLAAVVVGLFIVDKTQTTSTLRRNYPVIAHGRYLFEKIGEFLRQYFFAFDRDELPFNRAERSWVYRAAKNIDATVPFGSTRDLRSVGTVIFVNAPFPKLENELSPPTRQVIGPDCPHPYETDSFFNISGMSFGAISTPAIKSLSHGAARAGCWMNTGEGGLSPYHLEGGADIVFQIGTAKFGIRCPEGGIDDNRLVAIAAHQQVKMFEIKLSQGAKPGKGGILPGVKVTPEIAEVRGVNAGEDAISPNRHPDIANAADLLDMVAQVRGITGKPVGVKMVAGNMTVIDLLTTEILQRGVDAAPDFITVDSADGGTGAAPMSLIDSMGMPLRESLPQVVNRLTAAGLRERIKICASGKLINPSEVAWALCAGADFVNSARGFMFALGCIQALQCNKNTCPTGITTHNKKLQLGLNPTDKAVRVEQYVRNIRKEVGIIAHSCGVDEPLELSRKHARIITSEGTSQSMETLYA